MIIPSRFQKYIYNYVWFISNQYLCLQDWRFKKNPETKNESKIIDVVVNIEAKVEVGKRVNDSYKTYFNFWKKRVENLGKIEVQF